MKTVAVQHSMPEVCSRLRESGYLVVNPSEPLSTTRIDAYLYAGWRPDVPCCGMEPADITCGSLTVPPEPGIPVMVNVAGLSPNEALELLMYRLGLARR